MSSNITFLSFNHSTSSHEQSFFSHANPKTGTIIAELMLVLPNGATIFKGREIRIYSICMNIGISLTRRVQKSVKIGVIIMLSLLNYNLAQRQPERHVTINSVPPHNFHPTTTPISIVDFQCE